MWERRERVAIAVLCGCAALRVLFFSAVFPFFDNVDETSHFDLVSRYSRGDLPTGLDPYSVEGSETLALYATIEYIVPPEKVSGDYGLPLVQRSAAERAFQVPYTIASWRGDRNHEAEEPPLYYALAGLWLALGRALGVSGTSLLYWVRALNALPAATLVWLGAASARAVLPESRFAHWSVPVLLAVYPQDAFYSMCGDVLSPVCFGAAFLGLARGVPQGRAATRTGVALAATVLSKASNLPAVAVAACFVAVSAWREPRVRRGAALLLLCAGVPIALWLAWNRVRFGDWTGTADKIAYLHWTRKSLADWLPHPLFSLAGVSLFGRELLATFWRGEFTWHGAPLRIAALDAYYALSTLAFLALAARKLPAASASRNALALAALVFAAEVAFLVVLSLAFDFDGCFYPSRERPYFTSGRLLGSALIPVLLLYVRGLDVVLARSGRARWWLLGAMALALLGSELWLARAPAASHFNLLAALS